MRPLAMGALGWSKWLYLLLVLVCVVQNTVLDHISIFLDMPGQTYSSFAPSLQLFMPMGVLCTCVHSQTWGNNFYHALLHNSVNTFQSSHPRSLIYSVPFHFFCEAVLSLSCDTVH